MITNDVIADYVQMQNKTLQDGFHKIKAQRNDLEQELMRVQSVSEAENSRLVDENQKLEAKLAAKSSEGDGLDLALPQDSSCHAGLRTEISSLGKENADLQEKLSATAAELTECKAECDSVKSQVSNEPRFTRDHQLVDSLLLRLHNTTHWSPNSMSWREKSVVVTTRSVLFADSLCTCLG